MSEAVDLLIQDGLIVCMDDAGTLLYGGDVAIRDGRISAVGRNLDVLPARRIHARQSAVLPGLVDAHMHETLMRGIAEDLPLDRWLAEICFPLDRAYSATVMHGAAMMSQYEMIRGGITTFLDIYRYPDACAKVAVRSGLRGLFAPQIILDPLGPGETLDTAEAFVSDWVGRHPRVMPLFGPHAPYSVPPAGYQRVSELAQRYDVGIHTHLSETRWEVQTIAERYGAETPVQHLERLGLLSPRLSTAHGVHLTASDMELLAERGVSVVYNPSSNMKLASGVAPIPEMIAAGVQVAVATDSNLSNNNLDMFEEMRLGAMLQKLHRGDAAALPVRQALYMATLWAARALGLGDQLGSIEVGKQADLILIDLNQPHLWPLLEGRYANVIEQLVYSAGSADVTHSIVAGQILMENRTVHTLDLEETREAVEEASRELLNRAGMQGSLPYALRNDG